jgi:PAS domain S-box-containing protein
MIMASDRRRLDDLRAAVPGDPGQAALFRPAVESAPVGVLMVDGNGDIVLLNRELERMLGYAREELLGQSVERLIPERSRARHAGFLAAFSAQPSTRVLGSGRHLSAVRKDGTEIPVEIGLNPFGTDAGTYVIAFIADISERKLADEALRASERRLRTLFETVNLIVLGLDGEGKVDYVNPYFLTLAGYTRDEVVGRDWFEFIPKTQRESMRGVFRELLERELHPHYENPIVTKAGVERMIAWHNTALRDEQGRPTGTLSIGADITDRKRSEEIIRHLTLAVEQSPAGVVITDTAGTIQYVNRKFTELTGFSAAEALGKNPRIFKSGNTSTEVYRELWGKITAGEEWRGVMQNRRKDGSLWWNAATVSPMRDVDGNVTHFLAIQQDVTQQRQLEDQLRQAQKMEAVGRLAGGVAHDFNNLLTVISSYSELLLDDLPAADQARRDDLGQIKKAAADASALTRQLLAFSRQQVLEAKVLDLNAIVSGAGKMLQRVIGEDITLALVLAPKLGWVKADPGQVEQVIMNLAVNARDAMPDGGKLTIETTNTELDAGYIGEHGPVAPGSYVRLVVSDTGVGMDDETRRRIFEPFFTTKEQGKGTGLGLATVYGIVKQSGGFVWVYSEPGKGAAFKIYLPQVVQSEGVERGAETLPPPAKGTETVLLAEDAASVRAVTRQILERQGYTVLEAPSGRAAVDIAAKRRGGIHLLLTDVVMPEMSGRQLADQLAELRPEIKVLFISGYTDDSVVRHGVLEAGVAYLQKPFTPDSLARKVREVLDRER